MNAPQCGFNGLNQGGALVVPRNAFQTTDMKDLNTNVRAVLAGIAVWSWLCVMHAPAAAQHANDTLLFTIPLSADSNSLFICRRDEEISHSLSGPVIMAKGRLLFYSRDGYVLYNTKGRLIDSHSLIRRNRRRAGKNKPRRTLAYPLDRSTLIYYQKCEDADQGVRIFKKKLRRRFIHRVKQQQCEHFSDITDATLFNLAMNGLTDEMQTKSFLQPHLVGYESLNAGKRWWSLDRFYSFTSPLILENDGAYESFFPGFKSDDNVRVKKSLIEPLGVFEMGGRWYYYGIYAPMDSRGSDYTQKLFLCDQAGNLLYINSLLKRTNVDAVLGEDVEEKMLYTVKKAGRHVFLPAVDEWGDIYYGVIDYQKRRIEVMKRYFYTYKAFPSGPRLEDALSREKGISSEFEMIDCIGGDANRMIPRMTYTDQFGKSRHLSSEDLSRKDFLVEIQRRENPELRRKIERIHRTLPDHVQAMQDSLSKLFTAWCPYSFVLSKKNSADLCSFDYGLGDVVLSARVLAVTSTFEVFVRIDLENWAEIVIFTVDGQFVNRFTFNQQPFGSRKDLVAVSPERLVIEKDYEIGKGGYRYLQWDVTAAH